MTNCNDFPCHQCPSLKCAMRTPAPAAVEPKRDVTYTLPMYWASYLVNDDASGLEPGEKEQIDNFLRRENLHRTLITAMSESYFSRTNDSGNGLGGDVIDYTFFSTP